MYINLHEKNERDILKYTTLQAFEKHLEGAAPNHFSEIYLVMGKEPFVRKQAVERLTKLVLKDESSPALCQHTFDGDQHKVEAILQELNTLAFFAKKKLIIVQNADAFNKDATTKLENYFTNANRASCLVLVAETINRATNFYKKAEKVGIVLDIAEEKPWEKEKNIADWLRGEAAKQGKQINANTCQQLVKQLGTDQSLLFNELLKVVCYVGNKPQIDERDVSAVCGSVNLDNGWQLGEAIFRNDAATALRISKALLDDGVAVIALLRQIRSQFQTEFQVCSILLNGGTANDVAQEFPYMKGAILERHVRQSQAYGVSRFRKGLLAIDDVELQAKNSGGDPDFLTERLIIKLATI